MKEEEFECTFIIYFIKFVDFVASLSSCTCCCCCYYDLKKKKLKMMLINTINNNLWLWCVCVWVKCKKFCWNFIIIYYKQIHRLNYTQIYYSKITNKLPRRVFVNGSSSSNIHFQKMFFWFSVCLYIILILLYEI